MHTLLARLKNQKSKSSELDKKDSEIPIKNVDENNPQVELNEENVEPQEPSPSETANAENNEEKPVSHTVGETETTEEKSEEKIEQKAAEDTEEVRRASGASKTSFNPPNIGAPEEAKEKITKDSETENAKDQKIKKKRKSKKKEKDNKDGEVEDKKSSVTDLREDKADAKEPNQASKPEGNF